MALDINKLNGYELYGKNQNQKVGANPFAAQFKPEQKITQPTFQGGQQLDPAMLSMKKASFENGLGGTNDPSGHKLFFAA